MASDPTDFARRSPLHRVLTSAGAEWSAVAGGCIPMSFRGADEAARARTLGLADLSVLPRVGFKGREAPGWLELQGLTLPSAPNLSRRMDDGALLARLSAEEHLLLSDVAATGDLCARLVSAWSMDTADGVYALPRSDSHAWLLVTGTRATEMFAKLCAIDLRAHKFADGAVAQTSIARVNGIVIRADLGDIPGFHLLFDWASADYLWGCLIDAADEFGGGPVGRNAVLDLITA